MTCSHSARSSPDKRLVAQRNELSILQIVRDYGHLRRSEIARAVWPHSTQGVAEKMAYRTVSRLIESGNLRDRPNSLGGRSVVLTSRGASVLRSVGVQAHDGHELSSVAGPQFYHRTIGTRYLIERSTQGHASYGEYALSKCWAPVGVPEFRARYGKLPDGIVVVPGAERGYDGNVQAADWIEVESSYKPEQELFRIFEVAWKAGTCLGRSESLILDRVVFVYDESQRHENQIVASLKRYMRTHPANETLLSSIVFVRCKLSLPLVWLGHSELDYRQLSVASNATFSGAS
jgi:hypothetical protein